MRLTNDEVGELNKYISAADDNYCDRLNENLRNGMSVETLPSDQRDIARSLDSAIARQPPLDKPMMVYRGITSRIKICKNQETFLDFTSTTKDLSVALQNVDRVIGATLLVIALPVGARVLDINGLRDDRINDSDECEVLLGRANEFQVESQIYSLSGDAVYDIGAEYKIKNALTVFLTAIVA